MDRQQGPAKIVATTKVHEKIVCTTTKYSQFSYAWSLTPDEMNSTRSWQSRLTSKTFSPGKHQDVWRLELSGKHGGGCSLHLCLISSDKSEIEATFILSMIKADGGKIISKEHSDTCTFVPGTANEKKGFSDFVSYDNINQLYGSSCRPRVTILCKVNVVLSEAVKCNELPFNVPECKLLENLTTLFEKRDNSDLTINVCGRTMRAHKAILAMSSPVFGAMFEHEMAEKMENQVTVDNVEYEVFQEILRFVYTGKVVNIDKLAEKLLAAADMFDLERLKVMCEEVLRSNIAINNAAEMLILADLYNAKQLKLRTAAFIDLNLSQVIETEGFQSMIKSHSFLMADVLRASLMR